MRDNYQAVFDAVFRQFDISHLVNQVQNVVSSVEFELVRPSVISRPKLSMDGAEWCALYGDNLQDGCAGFGQSPCEAMAAFDKAWRESVAKVSS